MDVFNPVLFKAVSRYAASIRAMREEVRTERVLNAVRRATFARTSAGPMPFRSGGCAACGRRARRRLQRLDRPLRLAAHPAKIA